MPLTQIQKKIAQLISKNRSEESHLAGGAAMHISENSLRYSQDLDYFHDSQALVNQAADIDVALLKKSKFKVDIKINRPGFVQSIVSQDDKFTKIEWTQDSMWRFYPVQKHTDSGFQLHQIDLATNKVLALAGRHEVRDWIDTIYIHQHILPLGALCWAAVGKDPGFTPGSLFELIKRKGRFQEEEINKLHLKKRPHIQSLKTTWLLAIAQAQVWIDSRPIDESGCIYETIQEREAFAPEATHQKNVDYTLRLGSMGGSAIPQFSE